MTLRLRHLSGSLAGREAAPAGSSLILGREPGCDVVFDAERDRSVSGRHAVLYAKGSQWFVKDLGSANGVFVNGEAVQEGAVRHGDRIQLGRQGPAFELLLGENAASRLGAAPELAPEDRRRAGAEGLSEAAAMGLSGASVAPASRVGSRTIQMMITDALAKSKREKTGALNRGTLFVRELVLEGMHKSGRRLRLLLVAASLLFLALLLAVWKSGETRLRAAEQRAQVQSAADTARLSALQQALDSKVAQWQAEQQALAALIALRQEELQAARASSTQDRARLDALAAELAAARDQASALSGKIAQTNTELSEQRRRLELLRRQALAVPPPAAAPRPVDSRPATAAHQPPAAVPRVAATTPTAATPAATVHVAAIPAAATPAAATSAAAAPAAVASAVATAPGVGASMSSAPAVSGAPAVSISKAFPKPTLRKAIWVALPDLGGARLGAGSSKESFQQVLLQEIEGALASSGRFRVAGGAGDPASDAQAVVTLKIAQLRNTDEKVGSSSQVKSTASAIGKLLGQKVPTTGLEPNSTSIETTSAVTLWLTLTDAASGERIALRIGNGESKGVRTVTKGSIVAIPYEKSFGPGSSLGDATRQALALCIDGVLGDLEAVPARLAIARAHGTEITIAAGAEDNVEEGDTFEILVALPAAKKARKGAPREFAVAGIVRVKDAGTTEATADVVSPRQQEIPAGATLRHIGLTRLGVAGEDYQPASWKGQGNSRPAAVTRTDATASLGPGASFAKGEKVKRGSRLIWRYQLGDWVAVEKDGRTLWLPAAAVERRG